MSSPYLGPRQPYLDRQTVSSPGPYSDAVHDAQDSAVRPMRLKVLYTFDDQNKTNCLVRWPRVLNVRTAFLDETTQIGVIELKTCIEAITSVSPEIVAKLGQDYTVYAYDYSEFDVPLVGQGMLSWILASASPTRSAPADQSRTLVTGRVCNNVLGLFSGSSQETLEVKLRLVPVPTMLQSEYLQSMERYRELSQVMPEGFDAQAWSDFLRSNPNILSTTGSCGYQSPSQTSMGIEHVQRLVNQNYKQLVPRAQMFQSRRESFVSSIDGQETRIGSPTPSMQSTASMAPFTQPFVRPDTRASVRSVQSSQSIVIPNDNDYLSNEERADPGPARKRAKMTKVDHPTKSTLGKKGDSLRVTASTAASVRVFQPVPVRPSMDPVSSLEEPPRAPTPISRKAPRKPALRQVRSSLATEMSSTDSSEFLAPHIFSEDIHQQPESTGTSPDTRSIGKSPTEVPGSSPPEIRHNSVAPSSPGLPPLPQHRDSGFMSGTLEEFFKTDNDPDPSKRGVGETICRPGLLSTVSNFESVSRAAQDQQIYRIEHDDAAKALAISRSMARNAVGACSIHEDGGTNKIRKTAGIKRSQTWSGDHPSSDTANADSIRRPGRVKACGAWDKNKRKEAVQSRLQKSIAAGSIPPYCDNCGAIETPVWRKAYSRIHSGSHENVVVSKAEGGIIAFTILERNPDGSTALFKITKKSLAPTDIEEDYQDMMLCNPCGIWLHKNKSMRPKERFGKDKKKDDDESSVAAKGPYKKRRYNPGARGRASRGKSVAYSDVNFESEDIKMQSELEETVIEGTAERDADDLVELVDDEQEPELPSMHQARAGSPSLERPKLSQSDGCLNAAAIASLQRAIQSSPARFIGSRDTPIELDGHSSNTTRRALFSSPKTAGPLGIDTLRKNRKKSSPPPADPENKENEAPPSTVPDPFEDIFSDIPMPVTPSRGQNLSLPLTYSDPFKTPTRKTPSKKVFETGDFFSSAAKALFDPQTPHNRTPGRDGMSHIELTPLSRSISGFFSQSPSKFLDNLPPLADVSTPNRNFTSVGFGFADFSSTDFPMLSSPPGGIFGIWIDPAERRHSEWDELGLGTPLQAEEGGDRKTIVEISDLTEDVAVDPSAVSAEESFTS